MSMTDEPDWLREDTPNSPKEPLVVQDPNKFGTFQGDNRKSISDNKRASSSKCCGTDGMLCYFRLISWLVVLCSVSTMGINIYHIYKQDSNVRDYILRGYGCVFSVVIVLIELNVQFIVKGFAVLDNWCTRGLFYAFVGLITLDDTNSDYSEIQDIVAFVIMGFGAIYCLMGLACMRTFKKSREKFVQQQQSRSNV